MISEKEFEDCVSDSCRGDCEVCSTKTLETIEEI